MFTFADEKKVTDRLPKYVADSPDAMPYLRMVDSDFKLLLGSMDKMQVMIDHVMGAVQTMHKFMHEQMTGYNTSNRAAGSTVIGTAGLLNTLQSATVSTDAALCDNLSASNSWAQVVQSANERAVIEASGVEVMHNQHTSQQGGGDEDGGPYQLVVSRRSQRTKRRRVQSRENNSDRQHTSSAGVSNNSELDVTNRSEQSQPVRRLIGKKRIDSESNSLVDMKLVAARPYLGKAVFCVDNIATDVSEADLANFVKTMDVSVISCHKVKPRRSAWQRQSGIMPRGRNTFRLCVASEDTGKLLDAERWPEHISISRWFFTKRREQQETSSALPTDDIVTDGVSPVRHQRQQQQNQSVTPDAVLTTGTDDTADMDATINYDDGDGNV